MGSNPSQRSAYKRQGFGFSRFIFACFPHDYYKGDLVKAHPTLNRTSALQLGVRSFFYKDHLGSDLR
jgi:hypothetical protein